MESNTIELHPEQVKVLFLSPKNPIGIKGVAGCGKTTVALYRAKHLIETYRDLFSETKVAIFTYNKSLVKYMNSLLPFIPGGYQENSKTRLSIRLGMQNINVTNFHKWAYEYLTNKGLRLYTLDDSQIYSIVNDAKKNYPNDRIAQASVEFFKDEISWIKGRMISSEIEYLETERRGRGNAVRVTKDDRIVIWKIYQQYQNILQNQSLLQSVNYVDFDDYAILCHQYLNDNDRIFSHIIIDEAQDLSKAQLMALYKLVSLETKSITIIGDAAQKIFRSAFSWSDTGIELRGRSVVLKENARNTYEIADAAFSLLRYDNDPSDFTDGIKNSNRHGKKPEIHYFSNSSDQYNELCTSIRKIKKQNPYCSIAVLHRSIQGVNEISQFFKSNNIVFHDIRQDEVFHMDSVNICTMSSIKGLEFDYVFIVSLNEDIIPALTNYDEDQIATERRLLYVCMTRAKNELFMYSFGEKASCFLYEIESGKTNIINHRPITNNNTTTTSIVV